MSDHPVKYFSDPETGTMQVTIRDRNRPEMPDIVAAFQRYEYNVKPLLWRGIVQQ